MKLIALLAFLAWQQAEEPKRPAIEGKVVEQATGAAVAKASVTIMRLGSADLNPPKVETEPDGTFVFEDAAPGSYLVLAEKAGYSRRAYGAKNDGALRGIPVRVQAGERRRIEIALVKQGVVTGKVTDADGEPVQGVVMFGLRQAYQRGRKSWLPVGIGQMPSMTSDTGEYRLTGLPAGQFRICAMPLSMISGAGITAPAARKGPSGKPEAPVVTCYPSEPEVERAVALDIGDGAELPGIEIRLAQRIVATVKGQIAGLPADAPQMIALSLSRPGVGMAGMMFSNRAISTGGEGKFEFRGVQPGRYVLHTLPMPVGAVTLGVKMPVEVTDDEVQEVAPAALLPFEIDGRVVVEGKEELPALGSPRVMLTAADEILQSTPMAPVRDGGVFRLAGVTADRYEISISGLPEGLYLKSVITGSRDWGREPVDLSSAGQPLTLVLGDDAAAVTGTVRDQRGEAAPGAYVVLLDHAHRPQRSRTARADEKGVFRMNGVPPGDYRVFAATDVDSGGVDDPEYVKPWLSRAVALKAGANERPTLDLILH